MRPKDVIPRLFLLKTVCVTSAAVALALTLAGCASDFDRRGDDGFMALWARPSTPLQVPMFVASTRRDDGDSGNHCHFSVVSVSIPPNHHAGSIERATFGRGNPTRDFVISSKQNVAESEFVSEIVAKAATGSGADRDVLLYVHGYDIDLDEARFRTAQLVVDSGFSGIPALFTWDSISRSGLSAYEADKESATVARDALEKLIVDLSKAHGVRRVHILAHSMGAWLAMEGLRAIAIAGHPDLDGRLGEVMLAAPDIDLGVFSQQLMRVGPEHVTIFISSTDRALSLSSRIAGDRPRLGAMDPSRPQDREVLEGLGVAVRDLSRMNTDFVGHNTFAEVPAVVRLIGAQLVAEEEYPSDRDSPDVREAGTGP